VANFERQTWDKAEYERRAQLRASGQVPEEEEETPKVIRSSREEFKAASEDAAGPAGSARAFLKARTQRVSLDGHVGTVRVVKTDDLSKNGGYFCEVCECTLKDSVAYLDHINGKRHLRKLGYSMRVERSTVDQVKSRLQSAAKRKYDPLMTKKLDAMEGAWRALL
jgi:U4/U6.U5 tri-snRNP component SNU23